MDLGVGRQNIKLYLLFPYFELTLFLQVQEAILRAFQCTEKPFHLKLATVIVPLPHVHSWPDQPRDQPSLNHDLTILLLAQSNGHTSAVWPVQTLMNLCNIFHRTYRNEMEMQKE